MNYTIVLNIQDIAHKPVLCSNTSVSHHAPADILTHLFLDELHTDLFDHNVGDWSLHALKHIYAFHFGFNFLLSFFHYGGNESTF